MKKTIILLAGYPGTGKSYLCDKILAEESDFVVLSLDEIKEGLFDQFGYQNLEEKDDITNQGWQLYYEKMRDYMKNGIRIISDYPFSEKQRTNIKALSNKYDYDVITVRLIADLDVLFQRQCKRDLDTSRHLSHIVSRYKKGDVMEDRTKADCLLTYEEFISRCKNRGYGTFALGHLIEMDVTEYDKIDYPAIIKEIKSYL